MELENERKAPPEATLNKRYAYKLSSNVVAIFVGILTSAIVPRALGVNAFGNFSFANNVIGQMLSFLDMRASTCFYVKLSQRQSESKLITFYFYYTAVIFFVLVLILAALTFPSSREILFEGVDNRVVWLAFAFVASKWIADILIKISDAYGTTVTVERIKMANQVISIAFLIALFYLGLVTIEIFYLHQILMFVLLGLLIFSFFKKGQPKIQVAAGLDRTVAVNYAREFAAYSAPLAFYLVANLVTEIFDRYILQHFGGSYQQGLYGFSFSMSSMTILFVTAIIPLFTRELSIAFAQKNTEQATSLYRKYVPTLYIISAYFCCFLLVNADTVIHLFAGIEYVEALIPLRIMLLYPLVSTYSNLNGSVIYAKSSTAFIRNMTMITLPIGILGSYFLVSSAFLELGATGLAIKMVCIEFFATIAMLLHISKSLTIKVHKYLLHMLFSPIALLLAAFGIKQLLAHLFTGQELSLYLFLVSGLLYTALFALITYFFPIFMGLSKDQITTLIKRFKSLVVASEREN